MKPRRVDVKRILADAGQRRELIARTGVALQSLAGVDSTLEQMYEAYDRVKGEKKGGLYRVTTSYLCAGFVVERDGTVGLCAPILQRKLDYWKTIAVRIGD